MVQSVFGVWDYAIMAATMVVSIAIGLYFRFSGGKQATNEVNAPFLVYNLFIVLVNNISLNTYLQLQFSVRLLCFMFFNK